MIRVYTIHIQPLWVLVIYKRDAKACSVGNILKL
jgi:hypothetical protein